MKWFVPFTCENHGFRFSGFIVTSHWFDQAEIVERSLFNLFAESTDEITSSSNNESSANRKQSDEILVAISLIYIRNKRGPSTDPCGTSTLTFLFPFRTSSFDYNTLLPSS